MPFGYCAESFTMATSAQRALHTCCDHENEETDMYCKTCKKPVCVKCVRNDHKEHNWDSIKNVAKFLRVQTKQRKLEMESVSKSAITGVTEVLDFFSNKSEKEFSSNCSELEATRKDLIQYVNGEIEKMKCGCESRFEEKKETTKKIRDLLKAKENRLNLLIREMESGAIDFTDFDLIEMHEELKVLLSEVQNLAYMPSNLHDAMVYTKVSTDLSSMVPLLGTIVEEPSSTSIVFQHEFEFSKSWVSKICPISDDKAWAGVIGETSVKLINNQGELKKTIDLKCKYADFAVGQNDMIYYCDQHDQCIKRTNGNGDIETVSSTAPLDPYAICLTRSGDLIVCISEEMGSVDAESSQIVLRRITKTDILIRNIEIECERTETHYLFPCRLLEMPNGDICISILYSLTDDFDFSIIYCIDCYGKPKFKYAGEKEKLDVRDICNDKKGNIVLFDLKGHEMRIIDSHGTFVRRHLIDDLHRPYSMAFLDNSCWIGDYSGLIQVYRNDI